MLAWFAPGEPRTGPAALLDRDGVLNEHIAGSYVLAREQFRWLPGALATVRRLCEAEWSLFVISNQSCVGQGLLARSTLEAIMADMVAGLRAAGARCDGWVCCPHRADAGCRCRKPGTAMLERVANDAAVDLRDAIMFGDSDSDVAAAHAAGARGVLVRRNDPESFALAVDRTLGGAA